MKNNKICTKCGRTLISKKFHKDKQKKDGYTSACKECNIEKFMTYYNYNIGKCNKTSANYYLKHKEEINFEKRKHKNILGQGTYNKLNPTHFDFGASLRKDYGISSFERILRQYKSHARRKNLSFELSKEDFKKLIDGNCIYCGIKPKQIMKAKDANGAYIYNGIDRLDSNIGYIKGNCVSACKICNRAKMNLPLNDFMLWIKRLITINRGII